MKLTMRLLALTSIFLILSSLTVPFFSAEAEEQHYHQTVETSDQYFESGFENDTVRIIYDWFDPAPDGWYVNDIDPFPDHRIRLLDNQSYPYGGDMYAEFDSIAAPNSSYPAYCMLTYADFDVDINSTHVRWYMNFSNFPSTNWKKISIFYLLEQIGYKKSMELTIIKMDDKLQLKIAKLHGTPEVQIPYDFQTNQWIQFDIYARLNGTSGAYGVWIDKEPVYWASGFNATPIYGSTVYMPNAFNLGIYNSDTTQAYKLLMDNVTASYNMNYVPDLFVDESQVKVKGTNETFQIRSVMVSGILDQPYVQNMYKTNDHNGWNEILRVLKASGVNTVEIPVYPGFWMLDLANCTKVDVDEDQQNNRTITAIDDLDGLIREAQKKGMYVLLRAGLGVFPYHPGSEPTDQEKILNETAEPIWWYTGADNEDWWVEGTLIPPPAEITNPRTEFNYFCKNITGRYRNVPNVIFNAPNEPWPENETMDYIYRNITESVRSVTDKIMILPAWHNISTDRFPLKNASQVPYENQMIYFHHYYHQDTYNWWLGNTADNPHITQYLEQEYGGTSTKNWTLARETYLDSLNAQFNLQNALAAGIAVIMDEGGYYGDSANAHNWTEMVAEGYPGYEPQWNKSMYAEFTWYNELGVSSSYFPFSSPGYGLYHSLPYNWTTFEMDTLDLNTTEKGKVFLEVANGQLWDADNVYGDPNGGGPPPPPDKYQFSFAMWDLDTNNVKAQVTWSLWNTSQQLTYTEGQYTLLSGTYTLKIFRHQEQINQSSLATSTYGNSTIDIYLQFKQLSGGKSLTFNNTVSSLEINVDSATMIKYTATGSGVYEMTIDVPEKPVYISKDGVNQTEGTVWTYSNQVVIVESTLSIWIFRFPDASPETQETLDNIRIEVQRALALLAVSILIIGGFIVLHIFVAPEDMRTIAILVLATVVIAFVLGIMLRISTQI